MRIWLAPSRYAPHFGGIETVVGHLARALTDGGNEVVVITHRHPRTLPELEKVDGILVRRVRFESPSRSFGATTRFVHSSRSVANVLDEMATPDVIHVHGGSSQMFHLTRYAKRNGIDLVLSTHGEVSGDVEKIYERSRFVRASFRYSRRYAKALTAPSQQALDEAGKLLHADPVIPGILVPNGIDTDIWRNLGVAPCSGRVLTWGRLERAKGIDRLVDVWPQVRQKVPHAELRIAGSGGECEDLVARRSPGITFLGRLAQPELLAELETAQFAAVPSRLEAFGMSALEALAAGRWVLHSGLPALNDLVGPYGWVAPIDDRSKFVDSLVSALHATPAAVPSAWVDRFEWSRVVSMYMKIYQEPLPYVA